MFVNKDPKQLYSSCCLLSIPWIVLTRWLLCKWLPYGDSVGTWGLYDYIKLLHTSTSVREVQVIQVHHLGERIYKTCRMRRKFQLRYHNVNDGSSKFNKSFRVNSRCMCTITPLICCSILIAAMCNSVLLEVCWYSVYNIILCPCDWSREQECLPPLGFTSCVSVTVWGVPHVSLFLHVNKYLICMQSFPRRAVTPSSMSGSCFENPPM